jgi:hypothetical protein
MFSTINLATEALPQKVSSVDLIFTNLKASIIFFILRFLSEWASGVRLDRVGSFDSFSEMRKREVAFGLAHEGIIILLTD